jgi:putative DNA primase/helicase
MNDSAKRVDDAIAAGAADAEIKRLAALPRLQYEHERKEAAEKLKVRAPILDKLVEGEKHSHDTDDGKPGRKVEFPAPEPWPEKIDGAELLDELATAIRRYIVMPDHSHDVCALWTVHTYLLDHFLVSPRLAIRSPAPGCGKTTLLDVLEQLVLRPLQTSGATAPVLFRVIEACRPTVLLDEGNKALANNLELLAVLNDGHRRGGQTLRNVAVGDDYEPRAFSTYSAMAIAFLKHLPPELHDRSVAIEMRRALQGERKEQFRIDRVDHFRALARKIARWTQDHAARIGAQDPVMPSGIYNREADNWRPLLAIADAAGEEWSKRARDAAERCHAAADVDNRSQLETLLADIRDVSRDKTEMTSSDLVSHLVALEGHPWAEMGNGKPLTPNRLARMLKPLGIIPENIWIGSGTGKVLKGYVFGHFNEAFDRYLLPEGGFKPLGRYEVDEMGTSTGFQTARPDINLAVGKCEKPNNDGHPSDLAVATGGESTEMRPEPPQPVGARPATNGRAAPGAFIDAQGKPTDDPGLGYYARTARAQTEEAYQAATEKQPAAVADVPQKGPPAADVISAADPVPARPMLEGDRRREELRARNREALLRFEAELRGRQR